MAEEEKTEKLSSDYFDFSRPVHSRGPVSEQFWLNIAFPVLFCKFGVIKVTGKENIPKQRGYMIAANHVSGFDPITVEAAFHRDMHFMTKIEFYQSFWMRVILGVFHGFPVNRGTADMDSLRYAIRVLTEGHILCLFPQGTRDKDHKRPDPSSGHAGAAMIAREAHCDVLPVSIYLPKDGRNKMCVRIGTLIKYEQLGLTEGKKSSRELKAATEKIMTEIGELWDKDADRS
jgi:1-acyl-sn-glycerol-3-phosphate acyltransferase